MPRPVLLLLVLIMGSPACGGDAPDADPSSSASAPEAHAEFTEADLDAFERGLKKEIDAVKTAREQARTAANPQDRGRALQAQFETATIPLGAQASGLDRARYENVRRAVTDVLRTLDFQGKINGPLSIDLERADEATKARLARDAYAELPRASADALRAKLDRLVPVWVEYVNLTAVAG
jgi:hypothetical protein